MIHHLAPLVFVLLLLVLSLSQTVSAETHTIYCSGGAKKVVDGNDISHTTALSLEIDTADDCNLTIRNFNLSGIIFENSVLAASILIEHVTCNPTHGRAVCVQFDNNVQAKVLTTFAVGCNITVRNTKMVIAENIDVSSTRNQRLAFVNIKKNLEAFGFLEVVDNTLIAQAQLVIRQKAGFALAFVTMLETTKNGERITVSRNNIQINEIRQESSPTGEPNFDFSLFRVPNADNSRLFDISEGIFVEDNKVRMEAIRGPFYEIHVNLIALTPQDGNPEDILSIRVTGNTFQHKKNDGGSELQSRPLNFYRFYFVEHKGFVRVGNFEVVGNSAHFLAPIVTGTSSDTTTYYNHLRMVFSAGTSYHNHNYSVNDNELVITKFGCHRCWALFSILYFGHATLQGFHYHRISFQGNTLNATYDDSLTPSSYHTARLAQFGGVSDVPTLHFINNVFLLSNISQTSTLSPFSLSSIVNCSDVQVRDLVMNVTNEIWESSQTISAFFTMYIHGGVSPDDSKEEDRTSFIVDNISAFVDITTDLSGSGSTTYSVKAIRLASSASSDSKTALQNIFNFSVSRVQIRAKFFSRHIKLDGFSLDEHSSNDAMTNVSHFRLSDIHVVILPNSYCRYAGVIRAAFIGGKHIENAFPYDSASSSPPENSHFFYFSKLSVTIQEPEITPSSSSSGLSTRFDGIGITTIQVLRIAAQIQNFFQNFTEDINSNENLNEKSLLLLQQQQEEERQKALLHFSRLHISLSSFFCEGSLIVQNLAIDKDVLPNGKNSSSSSFLLENSKMNLTNVEGGSFLNFYIWSFYQRLKDFDNVTISGIDFILDNVTTQTKTITAWIVHLKQDTFSTQVQINNTLTVSRVVSTFSSISVLLSVYVAALRLQARVDDISFARNIDVKNITLLCSPTENKMFPSFSSSSSSSATVAAAVFTGTSSLTFVAASFFGITNFFTLKVQNILLQANINASEISTVGIVDFDQAEGTIVPDSFSLENTLLTGNVTVHNPSSSSGTFVNFTVIKVTQYNSKNAALSGCKSILIDRAVIQDSHLSILSSSSSSQSSFSELSIVSAHILLLDSDLRDLGLIQITNSNISNLLTSLDNANLTNVRASLLTVSPNYVVNSSYLQIHLVFNTIEYVFATRISLLFLNSEFLTPIFYASSSSFLIEGEIKIKNNTLQNNRGSSLTNSWQHLGVYPSCWNSSHANGNVVKNYATVSNKNQDYNGGFSFFNNNSNNNNPEERTTTSYFVVTKLCSADSIHTDPPDRKFVFEFNEIDIKPYFPSEGAATTEQGIGDNNQLRLSRGGGEKNIQNSFLTSFTSSSSSSSSIDSSFFRNLLVDDGFVLASEIFTNGTIFNLNFPHQVSILFFQGQTHFAGLVKFRNTKMSATTNASLLMLEDQMSLHETAGDPAGDRRKTLEFRYKENEQQLGRIFAWPPFGGSNNPQQFLRRANLTFMCNNFSEIPVWSSFNKVTNSSLAGSNYAEPGIIEFDYSECPTTTTTTTTTSSSTTTTFGLVPVTSTTTTSSSSSTTTTSVGPVTVTTTNTPSPPPDTPIPSCVIGVDCVTANTDVTFFNATLNSCVCICLTQWIGSQCETCPAKFSPALSCAACAPGYSGGYPICNPVTTTTTTTTSSTTTTVTTRAPPTMQTASPPSQEEERTRTQSLVVAIAAPPQTTTSTTTTTTTSTEPTLSPPPHSSSPPSNPPIPSFSPRPTPPPPDREVTVSYTIPLKRPAELPLVKPVPATLTAIGQGASLVAGSTAVVAATGAVRNSLMVVSMSCGSPPGPLDVSTNPTGLQLGYDDYRYLRGVLVGTLALLGGLGTVLLVPYVATVVRNTRSEHDLLRRFVNKLFISLGTLAIILFPTSVTALVAVLAFGSSQEEKRQQQQQQAAAAAAGENTNSSSYSLENWLIAVLAGSVVTFAPLIFVSAICLKVRKTQKLEPFENKGNLENLQKLFARKKGKGLCWKLAQALGTFSEWAFSPYRGESWPLNSDFNRRYAFVFERTKHPLFPIAEMIVSFILACCVGLSQTENISRTQCGILAILILVVQVPPFLFIIITRSLLTRIDEAVSILMYSVNIVQASLGIVVFFNSSFERETPMEILGIVQGIVSVLTAIAFLSYFFRSGLLKELRRKRKRKNNNQNSSSDDEPMDEEQSGVYAANLISALLDDDAAREIIADVVENEGQMRVLNPDHEFDDEEIEMEVDLDILETVATSSNTTEPASDRNQNKNYSHHNNEGGEEEEIDLSDLLNYNNEEEGGGKKSNGDDDDDEIDLEELLLELGEEGEEDGDEIGLGAAKNEEIERNREEMKKLLEEGKELI